MINVGSLPYNVITCTYKFQSSIKCFEIFKTPSPFSPTRLLIQASRSHGHRCHRPDLIFQKQVEYQTLANVKLFSILDSYRFYKSSFQLKCFILCNSSRPSSHLAVVTITCDRSSPIRSYQSQCGIASGFTLLQ